MHDPRFGAGLQARLNSVSPLAALLVLLVLCVLVAVVGISLPTNHDEVQYLASAFLNRTSNVYGDFFYSQTPYFVIALDWWWRITELFTDQYYLSARIFNVLWSFTFIFVSFFTFKTLSKNWLFSSLITFLVVTSSLLDISLRVTRNDMMPLALSALALFLVSLSIQPKHSDRSSQLHFAAGLLIAIAAGSKQSYAFIAVSFAIYALAAAMARSTNFKAVLLPMFLGGLIGALPAIWSVGQHFQNFLYANIDFHRESHALYSMGEIPGLRRRIIDLLKLMRDPSLILLGGIAFAMLLSARFGFKAMRGFASTAEARILLLCGLASISVLISCLLVAPVHFQYLAPVLPFAGGAVAIVAGATDSKIARDWVVILGLVMAQAVPGLFLYKDGPLAHVRSMMSKGVETELNVRRAWSHNKWAATHFSIVRSQLHGALGPPDRELKIATLMSYYPIDAGFGFYPAFASAPFFYRTNDMLDARLLERLRGTSPSRVANWLKANDVQTILVGYDAKLEDGFKKYAASEGFVCFQIDLRGAYRTNAGQLLVAKEHARGKPDC